MERNEGRGPERLRALEVALLLTDQVVELLVRARCSSANRDQIQRSSESAAYNTADGSGHFQPGKKIYHYELAKGSAEECRAALYVLQRNNPHIDVRPARGTANMLCAMLVGLIKAVQSRRTGEMPRLHSAAGKPRDRQDDPEPEQPTGPQTRGTGRPGSDGEVPPIARARPRPP